MLIETRIPLRYVAWKVRHEAVAVLAISVMIELLVDFHRAYVPVISVAIPAFLGTAISLILSFKLNQCYDRWWEARKIWGAIVNDSRTLVRQALSFNAGDVEGNRRLAHRQIAWCYCLGQSLRKLDWKVGSVEHLDAREIEEIERHANKPLAIVQLHARQLAELADAGRLTDYQRVALDETLTRLVDSMGKAERIKSTVFPRTYRLFLHGFIYLFITLLSIALAEVDGMFQIAITTSIAIPFFLLEKTATHMQDPFENRPTDTAVTAIARTIDINLRQLVGETEVPPPASPVGFYLM